MDEANPHSRDLRQGRVSEPGQIYLITCATHQRKPVFSDWSCGRLLVKVLVNEQQHAATLAYVVMPDHLHWLIQLEQGADLASLMRTVKAVSSRKINRRLNRSGPVWQAGYHDRALRREENLVSAARYLVANPLRAGLVKRVGDYPLWDAIWL